jgi:hypothetical protein
MNAEPSSRSKSMPGMRTAPVLDPRSADDVAREVMRLLEEHAPAWAARTDPATGLPVGAGGALVAGFAHLVEVLIERLNRAPNKNLLAFLDLLGTSRIPPRPASAPLVFTLAAGGPGGVTVPPGTRVSAEPAEDGGDPPTFETVRRLEVVAAALDTVGIRDPTTDRCAVRTPTAGLLSDPPDLFRGEAPASHRLYIRHDELLSSAAEELRLEIELMEDAFPRDRWRVRWEVWNGDDWALVRPSRDGTHGLVRGGAIEFRNVPEIPERAVNGVHGRWLRCGIDTPVTAGGAPREGMVRARELPVFRRIGIRQELARQGLDPESAFADMAPLDTSKDFSPFGQTPRFGSTFYVSQAEAFSTSGGRVTLRVEVTNPVTGRGEPPIPRTRPSSDLRLRWEAWSGARWEDLGVSSPSDDGSGRDGFEDTTRAFSKSGSVTFALPPTVAATEVNGAAGHWIRARIVAGDYGRPSDYRARKGEEGRTEYELVPATLSAPVVGSITIARVAVREVDAPERALACNDFSWSDGTGPLRARDGSWRPFVAMEDRAPALYLGFLADGEARGFPGRSISLWLGLDRAGREANAEEASGSRVVWEYCGLDGWTRTLVEDGTGGLRQSGDVRLVVPDDFAPRWDFGLRRYWLRAVVPDPDRGAPSRPLSAVLHNAVLATHAVTMRDETLGSSNGTPAQRFRTRLAPVLPGQRLVVREDRRTGFWVPWHPVPDLYGSGPTDRHYVLDRMSGSILFGDGRRGAVPPAGRGNVRMAVYRSGGGSTGNVPAGSLSRLGTTVPYVAEVTNPVAARGGADAEDLDGVRRRAPAALRHRNRAVTAADYEDLAREATSEVARVRCVRPVADSGDDRRSDACGAPVRVVIVPRSVDPAPSPDEALVRGVRRYLEARCPVGVYLEIRGPDYVRVDVEATLGIAAPELAGAVEGSALQALNDFLHPLTGGRDRDGWPFGRLPERSDFQALLASLPGVERVVSVKLRATEPSGPVEPQARLVRPGRFRIRVALAGEGDR